MLDNTCNCNKIEHIRVGVPTADFPAVAAGDGRVGLLDGSRKGHEGDVSGGRHQGVSDATGLGHMNFNGRSPGIHICPVLHILAVLTTVTVTFSPACGAEKDSRHEMGMGAGYNINDGDTRQMFLSFVMGLEPEGTGPLNLRIEGNLDAIDDGKTTYVLGIAPMLRYYFSTDDNRRPFLEAGAGLNVKNRDRIGDRALEGDIVFSLQGTAGVEFRTGNRGSVVLSTRFRHLSNGGLYSLNQSVNFLYVFLSFGL
jgi:hypothetical protein